MRRIVTILAVAALAFTTLAPTPALADHRRDGYYDHHDHDRRYDHRRRHDDDDDDDAIVAGVVGLVLGLAVGAAVADSNSERRAYAAPPQCHDNYQRCAPPQQGYYQDDYRQSDYRDEGERYYDRNGRCVRTTRGWDSQTSRYIMVEVPC